MSKKSKIFALVASLIVATTSTLAGCARGGNNKPDDNDKPTVSTNMQISDSTRKIGRYDKFQLAVSTSISGDIVWSSSDANVAKVSSYFIDENGFFVAEIVALNKGTAKITATIGENAISCDIKVVDSNYYPSINFSTSLSDIDVVVGSSYDISAAAKANGIDLGASLTWYSLDSSIAEYSNGKILAKKAGNTVIGCEFEYEGEIIFKEINVNVKSLTYVEFNAAKVGLITRGTAEETQFTLQPTSVYKDSVAVDFANVASITYETASTDIISVAQSDNNAVVTAKGRGDAIVNAKLTLNDGTEITGSVIFAVAPIVVNKEIGAYGLNTADASEIPFTQDVEGTKVISATFAGVKVDQDALSFKDGKASIAYKTVSKLYGKNKTASISTDVADYHYTLDVVTCLITDVSQIHTGSTAILPQYAIAGGATTYDNAYINKGDTSTNNIFGYFALGADVDCGGISIVHAQSNWDAGTGFAGTLDGQGYTISNFKLNGQNALFGGMHKDAVIRNLNIVDFSTYQGGLFGWYFYGSYDNLFIKSNADTTDVILGHNPAGPKAFTNCTVVSQGNVTFSTDGLMKETSGSVFYTDALTLVGEELKASCDVVGLTFTQEASVESDLVLEVAGVKKIIYNGVDVSNETGVTIDKYSVTFSAAFISAHRGKFTFEMDKFDRYFIADFKLPSQENKVEWFAAKQTNGAGLLIDNYFELELDGEPVRILVTPDLGLTGTEIVDYTFDSATNKVSILGSALISSGLSGENKTLLVETLTKKYINHIGVSAAFAVTKASDFISGSTSKVSAIQEALGYQAGAWGSGLTAILTCDLDFNGKTLQCKSDNLWTNNSNVGFKGILDGRGYSMYNITSAGSGQSLMDTVGGGQFKNIRFINLTQSGKYGLSGWYNGIKFVNCYLDIASADYLGGVGCVFAPSAAQAELKDCIVISRGLGTSEYALNAKDNPNDGTSGAFRTSSSTIIISDLQLMYYAPWGNNCDERLATKYALADNILEYPGEATQNAVFNIAGVTKVLMNGIDVTNNSNVVTISENSVTLIADKYATTDTFIFFGEEFIKVITSGEFGTLPSPDLEVVELDVGVHGLNTAKKEGVAWKLEIDSAPVSITVLKNADVPVDIGVTLSDVTYADGELSIPYSLVKGYVGPSNALTAVIETETKLYKLTGVMATLVITDASQINAGNANTLNQMQRLGGATGSDYTTNAPTYRGYYVLGNDIDFGGQEILHSTSLWGNSKGALIQLDGKGYSFKNFKVGTSIFFDTLAQENGGYSAISNVGFIGEVTGTYGLFGYYMSAKFSNCYFDITVAEGKTSALATYYGPWMHGMTNCTFVLRGAAGQNVALAGAGQNWTTDAGAFNSSIVFIDEVEGGMFAGAELNAPTAGSSCKVTGATVYDYSDNYISVNVEEGEDATIELANVTKVLKDGKDVTAQVTIGANVVIPASIAYSTSTYIISGVDGDTAFAKVVKLIGGAEEVPEVKPDDPSDENVIELGNVVAWASETNDNGEIINKDFTYEVEGAITGVSIGIASVADNCTINDNTVTIPASVLKANAGEKVISIYTNDATYKLNATIATFGITKLSDVCAPTHTLAPWRVAGGATSSNYKEAGSASAGYIVLTKDLVGTGTEMFHDGTYGTSQYGAAGNAAAYGFSGTFDGCGYSISNVVMGRTNAWVSGFGLTRDSAVIKNLTMQFTTQGAHFQGLFNEYATGTIENCTFDITQNSTSGRVFGAYLAGLTVKDSTIIVRTGTGTLSDALALHGIHSDGNQGSSVGRGATFTNTILYTDYAVKEEYATNGLVVKAVSEAPSSSLPEVPGGDVEEPEQIKEVNLTLGNYILNTATEESINFVIEGIETAPKSVSYKKSKEVELDIATLTYDEVAKTLTIPYETVKGLYGPYDTTFTITTDSAIYTVKVVFVTLAISDASQINTGSTSTVNQMQKLGGAETGKDGSYYGYYILTNDINFNGAEILHKEYALWASAGGAHIQFNGYGFALKNFVVKSVLLFDTLGQDSKGVHSSFENVSFVGTVEGGYGLFGWYQSARFANCYFDLKVAEGKNAFGSWYGPWMAEVINTTFVISGINGGDVSFTANDQNTQSYNWSGSVMFIDNTQDSVVGGKLQNAKIYDYSDNFITVTVSAGENAIANIAGVTKVLKDGKNITANVEITETGVVIPVAEISEDATYVIFAGDSSKVVAIDAVKEIVNVDGVVAYASKTDNEGNVISNDFTYEIEGTVSSVKIGSVSVSYTCENGVVTIASSVLKANIGSGKVITISTAAVDYVISATIADFGVSKFSDISNCSNSTGTLAPAYVALGATSAKFAESGANATGYIVLLDNIDAEGKVFNSGYYGYNSFGGSVNPAYGFAGTIDGNGYTISNFVTSVNNWATVFGMSTSTRTFKNLTLVGKTGEGKYFEGLFGCYANSVTLDNVCFDIELNTGSSYGILGSVIGGMNVTDSTFIVRTGTKALDADALATRAATANDGGYQNKANSFTNSVVYTDYVVGEFFVENGLVVKAISELSGSSTPQEPETTDPVE